MKTKIKRHYRSAISVLLSVCMLVSCVAVGLIGTDAAKVDNYNPVGGVNWANYCMIGDAMGWSERTNDYHGMGSTVTYDCSAYIGQDMYFRVLCDGNERGVDGSPSVSINQWYALVNDTSKSAKRTVTKGMLTFKVTNEGGNGQIYVTADEDPVYKLYQSDGTAIATFTHADSSKTFTATTGTLTAGTTYQLYLGNSYTTYKCSTSGTLTTGSNVTLEKDKSNMISFTPSVTAPYIFTWGMDANRGTYSGTLSVEARTATITTAVSPSGAGTAQVSTSQSGEYGSSVTVPAEATVYLKAQNTNSRYEFSEWQAVSGLTFDNRTGATTSATATATATATAVFLPINYNLSRENPAHAKIKIPNQARWGETVTPTATTDVGFKISKYKYSTDGGSTWTDVTPGSGFIMPEYNVVVSAEVIECTAYTVTMTPNGNGSISARTADGQTISSGAQVNEGTVITFTAVPADQAFFTSWGGDLSGSVSPTTLTVNADKTVTATFVDNAYFVASYTSSSYSADSSNYTSIAMTRLNNGYYRSSTTIPLNQYFTVGKTAGSTTTYAKCGQDGAWGISNVTPAVTPQHWTSDAKMQSKYQNKIAASYVFYDPETDKIWLSSDPAGFTGVTIFAKDGSLASPSPGTDANPGTTCGWGNTTLTVTAGGSNKTVTNVFDSQVHKASLTAAEAQAATTSVTVSTTVSKPDYYVYGYDVNGATVKATNGSATFCPADLDCNISNFIEITPIYMLTDSNPNNPTTIRFYVRSFAGEIESRWGGELYCYAYENEDIRTNGNWPGQPMINLGGGTYYMDLPINTKGITLSNAAADWVHATTMGIALPTSGNTWEQTSWDNRNAYQCQSYDYDDFQYIYAKPGVGENDEDIIFDFKYKQGDWGKSGLDNFPDNQFEKQGYSETNFPNNLDPSNSSYQWEEYTDFYGNPVDLWGTRLTSNYNNNPVRIVVQGYYDTTAANSSYYATTYVVYEPDTPTGANPSYSIVKYTSNNMTDYGKLSRSEFLQRSAEDMGLTRLAGQPVEITYEYAICKNMSTKGTHPINQTNQYAERADGVWYYSETKPVKAKIKIQYADKLYGAYTDDTFEIDTDTPGTDYDGDPYTVNEGTVTKGKAYFIDRNVNNANRPSGAPFDVTYTNRTVEFAYSDGNEHYELQAEESPDGEYTFVGWYKETSNGLDKCPPGFTYSMEATTNETFVARYVKAPSGIKLAHKPVVTGNSGGSGNRNVKYEIYDNANLSGTPLKTGEANGSIVVDKKYIKYNQNYYLKVTYEVVPDGNSLPNGIYSTNTQAPENLISKEGFESHNTYNSKHVDVDNFALTPTGPATTDTTKVEFKVPIDEFFKQITGTTDFEFDEDLALLELFSDIDRKRNNINITKTVDYNNSVDKFSFIVKALNDHDTPEDSNDYTWENYVGKYTVGDDPTEHSFTGTISNVSGGQTIHIVGAPAGTVFQISEVDPATDTAYNFTNVTIDGATATDDIPKGKQFTMPNNGSVDMEFTNNIKRKDFTITKQVDQLTNPASVFNILVKLNGQNIPDTYTYVDGSTTKSFNNGLAQITGATGSGASITVKNVPVSAVITVAENNPGTHYTRQSVAVTPDGTVNDGIASFTVDENKNHVVTIVNQKKHKVTVTKQFAASDTDVDDDATAFKVKIEKNTGSGFTQVTDTILDSNNHSVTQDSSHYYEIHRNQTLVLPEYPVGTQIRVVEVDHQDNYYSYVSTTVFRNSGTSTDTWQAAGEASATKKDGIQFAIGTSDAEVTITNRAKRMTVVIKKETDHVEDGSVFGIDVRTKQHNQDDSSYAADTRGVVGIGTNTKTAPAKITVTSNPLYDANDLVQDGRYRVLKDNTITFSNIPVGTYFEVSEPYKGKSTVTKQERFTLQTVEAVYNNAPNTKLTVRDTNDQPTTILTGRGVNLMRDATFTVKNMIKRNTITIIKNIEDSVDDQNTEHTIKVTMLGNGAGSNALTGIKFTRGSSTTEYDYTSGSDLKIKQGEQIKFIGIPIGTYVTVEETAPGTSSSSVPYQFDRITVGSADDIVISQTAPQASFLTKDVAGGSNVTIYNKIQQFDFAVTKTTNITNDTTEFAVNVQTSSSIDSGYSDFVPTKAGQFSISGLDDATAFSARWNGTAKSITLKKDETLTIHNLSYGTYVRVKEQNLPANYICNSITNGTNTTADELADYDGGKRVRITGNKAVVINNLKVHDVTITKVLTNSGNTTDKFKITATVNDESTWTRSIAGGTAASGSLTDMEIAAGQRIIIKDVPEGATVTVTETVPTGFTCNSIVAKRNANNTEIASANTSTLTFTTPNDQANVTVTNSENEYTVTIQKEVLDSNDQSVSDTSNFTLNVTKAGAAYSGTYNYDGGTPTAGADGAMTIQKGKNITFTVKHGTTVGVTENSLPRGYELVNVKVGSNVVTTAQTITEDTTFVVTNKKLPTYDVTVTKKVVEGTADSTEFGVQIQTAGTPYTYAVNGGAAADVSNGAAVTVELAAEEYVVVSGLLVGEKLTVTETNEGAPVFVFVDFTVNGTSAEGTNKAYEYTVTNAADQNISVNNKEVAKYQFEIKYIYESYSAKTYKDNTAHDDDNRVEGANRSYTQTGEISREDLDTYFNKASDGSLSIKSDKRKDFINKFAPYEDDFMLNLVWDDSNPKATYDAPNKTIRLETTATSVTARTVRVKVKMPWSDGAYVAVPESKLYTTQYGDHVYDTDGSFLTAPQTLDNNGTTMYFKYWQIKTDYNEKDTNYSDTNSKRCYYDSFNMTMYQDSYVEAVYDTTETSFNPSAQSYADTENGEARIAFMETSRNQWNNNGDPVTNKLAGDRIYTDFQLTFGYKDILLNTAVESGIKTGFVMEQVALLDEEGGKFVTKTESEYKTRYDGDTAQKTTRENAVKAYIADKSKSTYTDALGAHTFKLNSNIALATLDNKNQCKHSVDMSNKVLRGDNLEEGTLKNYVYRAYTYIQLSDGSIVLSDPVYFTIYDVATINNGTTN